MDSLYQYLPYALVMAPSIAIAFIYLSLTLWVGVSVKWDSQGGLLRMFFIVVMTGALFGFSVTIGSALQHEMPEAIIRSHAYNMTIHEEFLIALCVEMFGALIFVPLIYGSDDYPIILSLVMSLLFLFVFFIFPIESFARYAFHLSRAISQNYAENFRVELLSLIVLYFFYSGVRILDVSGTRARLLRYAQLLLMVLVISAFVWYNRQIILEPEYENLFLALGAGIVSILVLAFAKLNDKLLLLIIFLTIIVTIVLLIGTQIKNFTIAPSTSINLAAELIGAITVALVLDTDMDV